MEKNRKWFEKYSRTFINALINVFSIGLSYSVLTAIYAITKIKAGDQPGQSSDIIKAHLYEMVPNIIKDSIIKCLLIMIVLFIPVLIYRFRIDNKVSLIKEFRAYIRKRNTRKKS